MIIPILRIKKVTMLKYHVTNNHNFNLIRSKMIHKNWLENV